jgi:hypothetical protein
VARPGGNLTGVNVLAEELNVKRLEILHEGIPSGQFPEFGPGRFPGLRTT